MRRSLQRLLDSPMVVGLASAVTLAIGVVFVFVWAPHPWGWRGIDQYNELALALSRGEPFATTDVPWGYAYYVAAFYRVFGEHPVVPVTAQVLINAAAPFLLYRLVRPLTTQRTAAMAALLTGAFSFNTVYASTLASDAVCTVLFLVSLVAFAAGNRTMFIGWFALSGFIAGLVPQFRPNMILLPAVAGAGYVLLHRTWAHVFRIAVFGACAGLALMPWMVRNYQLTGMILPTSTHGGVQLWYGTLQAGPYLESRAHNPRSIFETASFHYTSLADTSILIDADLETCPDWQHAAIGLEYWTDRDATHHTLPPRKPNGGTISFELPGQPLQTALYYRLEDTRRWSPANVFFITDDHLVDLDRHGDLLDVFDIVAYARHLLWGEPMAHPDRLDLDRDGRITHADLEVALVFLLPEGSFPKGVPPLKSLGESNGRAIVELVDGSTIQVPKVFSGRVTDLAIDGSLALALLPPGRPLEGLGQAVPAPPSNRCEVGSPRVNEVFYRREPHLMRRYMALAFDNIERDPLAFAVASAYRMGRLFVIRGTDDTATTQRFSGDRLAYTMGTILSVSYLLAFFVGAVVAWRQRSAVIWLLVPIVYVPVTICFVLTNMRYTITVQPLMFVFVALAVVTALRLDAPVGSGGERRERNA